MMRDARFALTLAATAAVLVSLACGPAASETAVEGPDGTSVATFAGGCFWCMEPPFDKLDGVVSTTSGYTGGDESEPAYEQVSAGTTGHAEAVRIVYDPRRVDYATLLAVFWRNIDPTAVDRQFCDAGRQYRSAIFYHGEQQKRLAEASRSELEQNKPFEGQIVTEIVPAGEFWPAEDYHQDYYQKNPIRYRYYRFGCGRDRRLKQLWGDEAGGAVKGKR